MLKSNKLNIKSNWDKNLNVGHKDFMNLGGWIFTQTGVAQCPSNKSQCCQSAVNTC